MRTLDFLGMSGSHFEMTSYDSLFWRIGRPLVCESTSQATQGTYASGLYVFMAIAFIVTKTPVFFEEVDCESMGASLALWIKNIRQLPF